MESPAGSSGGSAEGASEGRQPLTGPHLPPAAQAAQIKSSKKAPRPQADKNLIPKDKPSPPPPAARRAGGPNKEQRKSPRARRAIKIPSKGQAFPRRPPSAARRAGGPKKAGNESAAKSRTHRAARIKPSNAKAPVQKLRGL